MFLIWKQVNVQNLTIDILIKKYSRQFRKKN